MLYYLISTVLHHSSTPPPPPPPPTHTHTHTHRTPHSGDSDVIVGGSGRSLEDDSRGSGV